MKKISVLLLSAFSLLSCQKEAPQPENNPNGPVPVVPHKIPLYFKDSLITIQNAIQSKEGGYVLVGSLQNKDLILKIDEAGNRKWLNVMDDTHSPHGLEHIFYENNQLVAQRSERYGSAEGQLPVLKYFNEEGKLTEKTYINQHIVGFDVLKEEDGYVAIGDVNYFTVQKYNKQGTALWTEQQGNRMGGGLSIAKLQDGNYITIGGTQSDESGQEFLFKLDRSGKKIWAKPWRGYRVVALPDNGFAALTGHVNNKMVLRRFDGAGNQLWEYQPGTEVRDLLIPSRNSWLFNYGTDKLVYCVRKIDEVLITVVDNNGNLFKTISVPFKNNELRDVNAVSIIKTTDDGLFITYDTKKWVDPKIDGVINIEKIPSSKIITK